jgi:hypothetical protein
MERVIVLMLCCGLANPAIVRCGAGEHQSAGPSPAETRAWAFVEGVASIGFVEFRRRNSTEPLAREARAAILAALPRQGALVPTRAERTKLAALDQVFDLYNRLGAVDVKVVDVGSALVAVHERSVLLITRQALSLVSPPELQAIAAHELAHEHFWKEFDAALNANAYERLQELELRCDGLAVFALRTLGIDTRHLINAATKVTRHNERAGAPLLTSRQVSLERRVAFIQQVDAQVGRSNSVPQRRQRIGARDGEGEGGGGDQNAHPTVR